MEPQLPTPSPSPEQGPLSFSERAPRAPEFAPAPLSPEKAPAAESRTSVQDSAPVQVLQPAVPAQPATPVPAASSSSSFATDDTPLLAADDDLIEKEWVEKAKKVIAETKHDPHLQEQAVSRLQADYLQKRYNKTVKVPTDG